MTPGARVRVKLPGEHVWTGTLVSVAGDSMFVRGSSDGDTTLVRLSRVTRLDVSTGKGSSPHLVRNMAIWLGVGAAAGWVTGTVTSRLGCEEVDACWPNICLRDCPTIPPDKNREVAGTVIGGLAGGAIGLLVSRRPTEQWRPVSITRQRTSVSLSPGGGRIAIAF